MFRVSLSPIFRSTKQLTHSKQLNILPTDGIHSIQPDLTIMMIFLDIVSWIGIVTEVIVIYSVTSCSLLAIRRNILPTSSGLPVYTALHLRQQGWSTSTLNSSVWQLAGSNLDADPSPPSSAVGHERVELYLYSPYGPYGLYRASVPVQGWPLPLPLPLLVISVQIYLPNVLTKGTSVEHNTDCSINLTHVFFRHALFLVFNSFIILLPSIEIVWNHSLIWRYDLTFT